MIDKFWCVFYAQQQNASRVLAIVKASVRHLSVMSHWVLCQYDAS